jgi:hypothetical protein
VSAPDIVYRLQRDIENLLFEMTTIPELQRQILAAEIVRIVQHYDPAWRSGERLQ